MPTAFCPGHISCIFSPGPNNAEPLQTGSSGIGIRTSLGAESILEETRGNSLKISINGIQSDAPITKRVVESLIPGRGLEITINTDLPVSQGFGMSAAGAVSTALCACKIGNLPERKAWEQAHLAEIAEGGGLGDVAALSLCQDVPVRNTPGLPPVGKVTSQGFRFPVLTVAILGNKLETKSIIKNPQQTKIISEFGIKALNSFDGSKESLFRLSREYSAKCELESPSVSSALKTLESGKLKAGMCMLGNSIFSDAPYLMVKDALPDAEVFSLISTSENARILNDHS